MLIDCGEGIQTQFSACGLSYAKLDVVCISHLHGDHVFGLPGLIGSLSLGGRNKPLVMVGPPDLEPFIESTLKFTQSHRTFQLKYIAPSLLEPSKDILVLRDLAISTIPLKHRIETVGFCVSTNTAGRRIRKGVIEAYDIPYASIPDLREGKDFLHSKLGWLSNSVLTLDSMPVRTVAYFTDTSPLSAYPGDFLPPDLLIHDATFSESDKELALKTGHSTVVDAAAFAKTCSAKHLLLTHLSQRYKDRKILLDSAKSIFQESEWAEQGRSYEI